jgi:Cu(I)/Ag(I) efflux system periplasmic protein CusF
MKKTTLLLCMLFTTLAGSTLHAAAPAASAPASVANEFTSGEIRKIDAKAGKVTLKHEEIRNLGMSPMTMTFELKDPSALDRFKVGDQVRFRAAYQGGKYIVTELEPAR